ncbi:hypothetical protein AcW1_009976 [Taiwanofungus camphoratus]|nr:hypothetical protein AcW1_009976 [Antrodia cinnamomea]
MMSFAVLAVISALRVHAVTGRNWRLAVITLVLGLVPVGTNMFNAFRTSYLVTALSSSVFVCSNTSNDHFASNKKLLIATRICLIVSDLIVVAVTWYNTHDFMHPIQSHVKHSLAKLLTRDGTLYFLYVSSTLLDCHLH